MKKHLTVLAMSLIISVYSLAGFSKASEIGFLKSVKNKKPTLVLVSANWCLPCKVVHKWMEEDKSIKALLENYNVESYNFDKDKDMVKKYKVDKIPSFVIFNEDGEVSRKVGIGSGKKGLELFLESYKQP